jgi:hypothetical protein
MSSLFESDKIQFWPKSRKNKISKIFLSSLWFKMFPSYLNLSNNIKKTLSWKILNLPEPDLPEKSFYPNPTRPKNQKYFFTRTRLTRKVILPEPDPPEKYFPFTRPTRPMQDYVFNTQQKIKMKIWRSGTPKKISE